MNVHFTNIHNTIHVAKINEYILITCMYIIQILKSFQQEQGEREREEGGVENERAISCGIGKENSTKSLQDQLLRSQNTELNSML